MMNFHNILLVKLRAIGDSVLTLSALEALRKSYPSARITVLFPQHSVGLVSNDERVDAVLSYPRPALSDLKAHTQFYLSLQERHFDLALCLHASFRTGLIGWMSGAEARIIRNHSGRDWFSSLPVKEVKEPKSIIERDFDVIRALGINIPAQAPRLRLPLKARREATALAKKFKLSKGRSVLFFPGAGKPEKRWPFDCFAELKLSLEKKRLKCAWVLAPGEAGPSDALRVPDLLTLGALCAHAGWVLGNDSGPRHIAAASGAKTLTLFGPEALREWHPYASQEGHLALQAETGTMQDLEVERVRDSALKWIRNFS